MHKTRLEIAHNAALIMVGRQPHRILLAADVCWLWPGSRNAQDYGVIYIGAFMFYAHRISYEREFGKLAKGVNVRHRCDRPPCFNPAHLLAGTQAENMRDMLERGRHWRQRASST